MFHNFEMDEVSADGLLESSSRLLMREVGMPQGDDRWDRQIVIDL